MLKTTFALAAFATAAGLSSARVMAADAVDFGTPPSGRVPILFNDRHVYAKPSHLEQNRVVVATARGSVIFIPIRAMFEQMGADVEYDPVSRTIEIRKPGADIRLTIGEPLIAINGETRPLDVPPIDEAGVLMVPLRVVSESMGAYVQWEPHLRAVVIRYNPLNPPPPPTTSYIAPLAESSDAPVAATQVTNSSAIPPTPVMNPSTPSPYEKYVIVDDVIGPKTFNELSPGNRGSGISYALRLGAEVPLGKLSMLLAGSYKQYDYPHYSNIPATGTVGASCPAAGFAGPFPWTGDEGCVTFPGGIGQFPVAGFDARDQELEGHLGLRILKPHVYLAASYLSASNNYPSNSYPFPTLSGIGFGVEKLPSFGDSISTYASIFYYPTLNGNFSNAGGANIQESYLTYQGGITVPISKLFLDLGFMGDTVGAKSNAPSKAQHAGPYAGLGFHF